MKRVVLAIGLGVLVWWTGGLGLLAMLHWVQMALLSVVPTVGWLVLGVVWAWGLWKSSTIRDITVVSFKILLVAMTIGLLARSLFGSHDEDDRIVATALH